MGDEDFTDEELEILGEKDEDESVETKEEETQETEEGEGEATEETGETEETEEEEASEEEETEEPEQEGAVSDSAQKRIDQVIAQREEVKRKHDLLLRLGPEEYFKVYPDERPKQPAETKAEDTGTRIASFKDSMSSVVKGGAYDGMTLKDVYDEDPVAAQDIYLDWRDSQKASMEKAEREASTRKEEIDKELDTFSNFLAVDLFKKDTVNDLDGNQAKKVDEVITGIIDWMEKTNRFNYRLEDAYLIMNKDDLIAGAKGEGVKALIDNLKKGSTKTISSKKGSGGRTSGYEAFESLTESQMSEKINDMSDAAYMKFINNAPQSLKDKFPKVDWG